MLNFKKSVSRNFINLRGWRTEQQLLVIESDDWGSVRMPSKVAFESLQRKGYKVDQCPYNTNDALESNQDLTALFEVLSTCRDSNGHHPCITANNVVANPDFDKIHEHEFSAYYYEPFTTTLARYPAHDKVYALYKEGIATRMFVPQFHGREHVNVINWIKALQGEEKAARDAFQWEMFSVYKDKESSCSSEWLDAFAVGAEDNNFFRSVIIEGLSLFERLWGFKATSVIAPCYILPVTGEKFFNDAGIKHIQSGRVQHIPPENGESYKYIRRFTGQRNRYGQVFTIRNCVFEPSLDPSRDWVNDCLAEISTAFLWKKPAVISSHRLNYIGFLNEQNRSRSLQLLKELLFVVLKKWPNVLFMSSDQLGELIQRQERS